MEIKLKHPIPVPQDILGIKDIFKANGHKIYVVGGAVRDALLGKDPKDYDLCTDAYPDKVEAMMKEAGLRTLPTGKAFGVINVFTDQGEYEIATFRQDLGSGRRPDAVSFTNIEGDVQRRDLTINALFYDIDTQEVIDLVGGISDLKAGVVRTVGKPEDRFDEDRLRILRAVRFAGRFGSQLDPATDAALKKDASLEGISPERIRDEFMKGITSSKSTRHFLSTLDKYHLFDWIFKGLETNKQFIEDKDPIIVIATLLKTNAADKVGKTLNKLTYKYVESVAIKFLVALQTLDLNNVITFKRAQQNSKLNPEQIRYFAKGQSLDEHLIDSFLRFELSVSGDDVKTAFNLQDGPELGMMITKLEKENFLKIYN